MPHTVPACSAWFRYDSVHSTEQQLVPEFFDGTVASNSPQACRRPLYGGRPAMTYMMLSVALCLAASPMSLR